ncbi:hypothetical protein BGZ98_001638 [Dissophora globulifera]|nr:hypothetical protein BGZ98_001638 [Dissophora globulifera]
MASFDSLSIDTATHTVTVGSGAHLQNVQSALQSAGYALIHTTQFGGISIAGGMGTGAHGSTLRHNSNLGEMTIQLKAVLANGTAATFNQDSDLRHWRTHLGFLGVVFEVTLNIVPLFKVQASISHYSESILDDLGTLATDQDTFMAWWYPNIEKVVTYTGKFVDAATTGSGVWNLVPDVSPIVQDLLSVPLDLQADWCLLEYAAYSDMVGNVLARDVTSLIRPPFLTTGDGLYSSSAVGYPLSMIMSTCSPESDCTWSSFQVASFAVAVPIERLADAIAIIQDILRKTPFCLPLTGIFFRFSAATDTSMAVEYKRTTAHIELDTLVVDEVEASYGRTFLRRLVSEVEGRMHWGKNSRDDFSVIYPLQNTTAGTKEFILYASTIDPNGVFRNNFSTVLGV